MEAHGLVLHAEAVPGAALFEHPAPFRSRCVGIVLSGGSADLERLLWGERV